MAKSSYRILVATVGAATLALPDLAAAQPSGAAAVGGTDSQKSGSETQTEAIFLFGDQMCVRSVGHAQCTSNFSTAIIGQRGQPPSVPIAVTPAQIAAVIGGFQGGGSSSSSTDTGGSPPPPSPPPPPPFFPPPAPPPPPARSDLLPENILLGSTSVSPGAPLFVSWVLANQGTGAVNSISTEELRITQSAVSDSGANLAVVSAGVVAPGASIPQSFTLMAPTAPGTYFVWVVANGAQHSMAFTVSPPPPPIPGSTVAVVGGANHSYDRYVISGTIGGGWQWRRKQESTAGNQGHAPADVQTVGTGAGGSQFLDSLKRFTSRVHAVLKSEGAAGTANRSQGPQAVRSGNHTATATGRGGR